VESIELFREIVKIKRLQDTHAKLLSLIVTDKREQLVDRLVKEVFGTSRNRARVYIAVDGVRKVSQIASLLRMRTTNVSRELRTLASRQLVERDDNHVYYKTVEDYLQLVPVLKRRYKLEE